MPILSPSIVILFLTLFNSVPTFNSTSVPDACKAAAASSPNINEDFCLTSLQADPNSASADPIGLAKIATNIAFESVRSTKAKIKALIADGAHVDISPQLNTCKSLYSGMVYYLATAANAISSLDQATAKTFLSAALDRPGNCEDAFYEKQLTPVLSEENASAKQLAAIALVLTNMC